MAGNWRVTSCNGGKGGFLFTEWQYRGKEHLIVPGIGQREKVVAHLTLRRAWFSYQARNLQIGESNN